MWGGMDRTWGRVPVGGATEHIRLVSVEEMGREDLLPPIAVEGTVREA